MRMTLQYAILSAIAVAGVSSAQGAAAVALHQYAAKGTYNATTYSFKAQSTGNLVAYFSGASAAYDSQLGLLDNGVALGTFGLDNHTSTIGQSLDFGQVHAGDTLVFVLKIMTLGGKTISSNPSMNTAYDPTFAGGANHIFSSAYAGGDPSLAGVPAGTFVGFEDLPPPNSDFDYNDETFVFTNVAATVNPPPGAPPVITPPIPSPPTPPATPGGVPEPATWAMMLLGLGMVGGTRRIGRLRALPG